MISTGTLNADAIGQEVHVNCKRTYAMSQSSDFDPAVIVAPVSSSTYCTVLADNGFCCDNYGLRSTVTLGNKEIQYCRIRCVFFSFFLESFLRVPKNILSHPSIGHNIEYRSDVT
jgi:hypothetical protein